MMRRNLSHPGRKGESMRPLASAVFGAGLAAIVGVWLLLSGARGDFVWYAAGTGFVVGTFGAYLLQLSD